MLRVLTGAEHAGLHSDLIHACLIFEFWLDDRERVFRWGKDGIDEDKDRRVIRMQICKSSVVRSNGYQKRRCCSWRAGGGVMGRAWPRLVNWI